MSEAPVPEARTRETWLAVLAAHEKDGSRVALAAADEALAAFPDDPDFLAGKGRQLILARRFDEAEACLAQALRAAPDHAAALLHLAQLHVIQGRYEAANGLVQAALAVEGLGEQGLVRAGRLLGDMGRCHQAAELLARAIAKAPRPAVLALHETALGGLGEDAAAGASPDDKALLLRAMEALRRGEPELAEPLFAELTRRCSGLAQAWIGLRGALEAQGRHDEALALKDAWASASPARAAAIEIGTRRRLSRRGLVFDPREAVPIRKRADVTRRAESGAELMDGDDAFLVLDPGGDQVSFDPIVSLDGDGADLLTVRYRTSPKSLTSVRNAALVGGGLVLGEDGEMIAELIPPARPSKYAGAPAADGMTFDPTRFRDGMGAVRIFERPALLMCGPTDASFGDWMINFPPRLAFAEAAGLGDLAVVVRRRPLPQALEMLAALGVGPERILFHDPEGVSLFPRLIVPSWPTPDKLAPSAGVYDVYRRLATGSPKGESRLLYISRKAVAVRRMMNEDEVCALFERRGFQAVDPGRLTFPEVRALFADAACVAGAFGSAFHNLAFAAGKPVSLVLLPDHTRFHLEEIAQWHADLGLRFGYLWGESLENPDRGGNPRFAPWIAPLERLDGAIDTILDLVSRTR